MKNVFIKLPNVYFIQLVVKNSNIKKKCLTTCILNKLYSNRAIQIINESEKQGLYFKLIYLFLIM